MKRKLKPVVKLFILLFFVMIILLVIYFCVNKKININDNNESIKIVDTDANTRSVAISINNIHAAYPHYGIDDAYLVYELIAEGGITRLLAFYNGKTTQRIGSIRSARHYFLDYVLENDAIFMHIGHSPQTLEDISSLNVDNIEGLYNSNSYFRDTSLNKAYEHTAFTSMEKINKVIENQGIRNERKNDFLLNYSYDNIDLSKEENSIEANNINLKYSYYHTTGYTYNPNNSNYAISMSGKAYVDGDTGKQYTTKNLIIYQVKNTLIDSKGRQELENIGSGEGYYVTNGYATKIKWKKDSRIAQTIYTNYYTNEEIKVNDGNTWIGIVPEDGEVKIE